MTEPPSLVDSSSDELFPAPARDHPPFKMRDRRLVLLPDVRPPSLEELRWAARDRRRRREGVAPEQRQPESHEQPEAREPADVPTSLMEEPQQEQDLQVAEPTIVLPDIAPAEDVEAEAAVVETESD